MKKEMSSEWLPDNCIFTGSVLMVTRASSLPSRVVASMASGSCSLESPSCSTRLASMKLSSAPESTSALISTDWSLLVRVTGKRGLARGEGV